MQPHSATLKSQTPPSRISFPLSKPVIVAGSALSSLETFVLEEKPEDEFWKIPLGIERNPEQQLVCRAGRWKRRAPGSQFWLLRWSHWTEVFPQLKQAQKTESLHEDGMNILHGLNT